MPQIMKNCGASRLAAIASGDAGQKFFDSQFAA
jgi:hypothetical protein